MSVYKITATIIKRGGKPTSWIHFSERPLTQYQCQHLLSKPQKKEQWKSKDELQVILDDFCCKKLTLALSNETLVILSVSDFSMNKER